MADMGRGRSLVSFVCHPSFCFSYFFMGQAHWLAATVETTQPPWTTISTCLTFDYSTGHLCSYEHWPHYAQYVFHSSRYNRYMDTGATSHMIIVGNGHMIPIHGCDADCLVALILFDLPLNTEFSLVINRSLGLLKDNLLYLAPVPKLSIEGLPMLLLNPIRYPVQHQRKNTLSWIFTLYAKRLHVAKSVCFMSPLVIRWQIQEGASAHSFLWFQGQSKCAFTSCFNCGGVIDYVSNLYIYVKYILDMLEYIPQVVISIFPRCSSYI